MTPSIAFIFPGQGSQSVGMGRAFYDAVPGVRKVYEEAAAVLGYDVAALCFDGPSDRLNLTEYTQPALLTASIAALRALEPAGFISWRLPVIAWVNIPLWLPQAG